MATKSPIYTRGGDSGETSLFGGTRVKKNSLRIACIGTTDELNASIGIVVSNLDQIDLIELLENLQHKLFEIGAELANPSSQQTETKNTYSVTDEDVIAVEKSIDILDATLPDLKNFILPSGTTAATQLHLSRAVCRRLERLLVKLTKTEEVNKSLIKYVNRLSDLLFVLARVANSRSGIDERIWKTK